MTKPGRSVQHHVWLWRQSRFVLLGLALLSVLTACSGASLLADRLPPLVLWVLDDYFDLDEAQEDAAEVELSTIVDWLRRDGMAQAQELMSKLRDRARRRDLDKVREWLADEGRRLYQRAIEANWPALQRLSSLLRPANLDHYLAEAEVRSAEWYEALESLEAKREDREEKLEEWFGDLNAGQREQVSRHTVLEPDELRIRIENGLQRRRHMTGLLMARRFDDLRAAALDPASIQTSAYEAWRARETARIDALLDQLFDLLSPEQYAYLDEALQDVIDFLAEMSLPRPD